MAWDKHLFHHISYTENHVKVLDDWNERMRYVNNGLNIHTYAFLCIACKASLKFWNVCFSFGLHQSRAMKADIWFLGKSMNPFDLFDFRIVFACLFIDTSRFLFGSRTFFSWFFCPDDGSDLHVVNYKMNSTTNYTHKHQTWNIGPIINLLYEYSQSRCDGKVCLCGIKCIYVCAPVTSRKCLNMSVNTALCSVQSTTYTMRKRKCTTNEHRHVYMRELHTTWTIRIAHNFFWWVSPEN